MRKKKKYFAFEFFLHNTRTLNFWALRARIMSRWSCLNGLFVYYIICFMRFLPPPLQLL